MATKTNFNWTPILGSATYMEGSYRSIYCELREADEGFHWSFYADDSDEPIQRGFSFMQDNAERDLVLAVDAYLW